MLYRPPKIKFLRPLVEAGRGRDRVQLAPANLGGVRLLLKALRRGDAVGILPDQVPAEGEGVWVDFFGRPAYTMTLAAKLALATGATRPVPSRFLDGQWHIPVPHLARDSIS